MFPCFAFSNLSPGLLLPAPLYTIMCSSIALVPLSLSRPNVLVASIDRYFSTGHLAQEINALLHIHCVICATKTPTTSLTLYQQKLVFYPSIHRCFAPPRAADAQFSLGSFLAPLNELERLRSPAQLSWCLLTEWRKISKSCASPVARKGLGYIRVLRMAKQKPLLAGIKNIFSGKTDLQRFFLSYFTTSFTILKMLVISLDCY